MSRQKGVIAVNAMIWTYKNDMQWCELHGKVPALVFQEMKPGWDSRVSKTDICKLDGLHPLTALLMEKIHVILFVPSWSIQ